VDLIKLFKRTDDLAVEFCDRCGQVCTSACRRTAVAEEARQRALENGVRFL